MNSIRPKYARKRRIFILVRKIYPSKIRKKPSPNHQNGIETPICEWKMNKIQSGQAESPERSAPGFNEDISTASGSTPDRKSEICSQGKALVG